MAAEPSDLSFDDLVDRIDAHLRNEVTLSPREVRGIARALEAALKHGRLSPNSQSRLARFFCEQVERLMSEAFE